MAPRLSQLAVRVAALESQGDADAVGGGHDLGALQRVMQAEHERSAGVRAALLILQGSVLPPFLYYKGAF